MKGHGHSDYQSSVACSVPPILRQNWRDVSGGRAVWRGGGKEAEKIKLRLNKSTGILRG